MEEAELRRIVLAFRKRLEAADRSGLHITLHRFPVGSCGVASEILAQVLRKRWPEAKLMLVRGELRRGGELWSHAWLELDGITIDITADQFGREPVIVARESAWHEALLEVEREPSTFDPGWWGSVAVSAWPLVEDLSSPNAASPPPAA